MTAQVPERLILDGRPHSMHAAPLYRLLTSRRMTLRNEEYWTTACHRGYCGTWKIDQGRLVLAHLNTMWPDEAPRPAHLRARLLRAMPARDFPVHAYWFNGTIRIPLGRRLVYSHHGWSSWYERERVMQFKGGVLLRDREVDTRAILEWWLKRYPKAGDRLDSTQEPDDGFPAPLAWFETSDDGDDDDDDWWPADYPRE